MAKNLGKEFSKGIIAENPVLRLVLGGLVLNAPVDEHHVASAPLAFMSAMIASASL